MTITFDELIVYDSYNMSNNLWLIEIVKSSYSTEEYSSLFIYMTFHQFL